MTIMKIMDVKLVVLGIFFLLPICAIGQLVYPVVGGYRGKSAQDMAIYEDMAYLMNDGGHCRVLNLITGKVERELDLACSGKNTHINSISFGVRSDIKGAKPLLYVSETNKPYRCFVEDINGDKPALVQTIETKEKGKIYSNHNWVVDRENGFLYGLKCFWHKFVDEKGNIRTVVTKYKLPSVSDGDNIILTEKEIIERFDVLFTSSMQGIAIHKGRLYIFAGMCEKEKNDSETNRMVVVIDLKKKKVVKTIDINLLTTNEPEGIDFFGNKCLLFCGQTGGIYRVKY